MYNEIPVDYCIVDLYDNSESLVPTLYYGSDVTYFISTTVNYNSLNICLEQPAPYMRGY